MSEPNTGLIKKLISDFPESFLAKLAERRGLKQAETYAAILLRTVLEKNGENGGPMFSAILNHCNPKNQGANKNSYPNPDHVPQEYISAIFNDLEKAGLIKIKPGTEYIEDKTTHRHLIAETATSKVTAWLEFMPSENPPMHLMFKALILHEIKNAPNISGAELFERFKRSYTVKLKREYCAANRGDIVMKNQTKFFQLLADLGDEGFFAGTDTLQITPKGIRQLEAFEKGFGTISASLKELAPDMTPESPTSARTDAVTNAEPAVPKTEGISRVENNNRDTIAK